MKKVYIASPFFNEEQLERVKYIEELLKSYNIEFFSPRTDTYVKPNSTDEERKKAFHDNVNAIEDSAFMVAVTDGKDVGTMFEIGYAYGYDIPIILFAETLGDKPFNLMLAMCGNKICKSRDELNDVLDFVENNPNWYNIKSGLFNGEIE